MMIDVPVTPRARSPKRRGRLKTRKPTAPPTKVFKDKSKLPFRERKHRGVKDEG